MAILKKRFGIPFFSVSSECLLKLPDYQRRNIEILKIRFGEAALQVCEVMLRDMTDSKRIDQHVQSQHAVRILANALDAFK
jgi:hypothetical protein